MSFLAQLYEEEDKERAWLAVSLRASELRHQEIQAQLITLHQLLDVPQTIKTYRLLYSRLLEITESFLMYGARALLNSQPHAIRLRRQRLGSEWDKALEEALLGVRTSLMLSPLKDFITLETLWHRAVHRVLESQTFYERDFVRLYFGAILRNPPQWPFAHLAQIAECRQRLMISEELLPAEYFDVSEFEYAFTCIQAFIASVAETLRRETQSPSYERRVH
ncbi:hypothetical protein LLS47_16685 [Rouxiella badensis]|uniref:hypothetical protein n=1 Tax=Rouxiella badensis TaxID=1646377 RepID=UPI0013EEEC16|nr:hypothetical protein [Rouxiella badensis]MCC3721206.1 hypothetical protein [Rouxiella badensis]MCC3730899.1 hypothetical protein [Rouxiella badensis]MCC3734572.1 hypothetical protein [Rouxiella badensis]MCC3742443.1 hypothetical protein [Rouxiella badensis]MCC3747660.1 hypothetical protein [Rouxiella badensis]